ncbi:MAG: four helix bundle protein [Anaerolineae bacterium]|nr:four helix bundle protein [Anaerolineae bacterium]
MKPGTEPTTYDAWEASVSDVVKADALWSVTAYRLALFVGELGWYDATKVTRERALWGVADQLYRALGSISANIAEGYSRSTGKDRARFYEYALGSTRESRDWYYKARHTLGTNVHAHRIELLTRITQLLIRMIPQQRRGGSALCEPVEDYSPLQHARWATGPIPFGDPDS